MLKEQLTDAWSSNAAPGKVWDKVQRRGWRLSPSRRGCAMHAGAVRENGRWLCAWRKMGNYARTSGAHNRRSETVSVPAVLSAIAYEQTQFRLLSRQCFALRASVTSWHLTLWSLWHVNSTEDAPYLCCFNNFIFLIIKRTIQVHTRMLYH